MKADANKSLLLALITVFVCPVPVQADEIANGYTPATASAVSNVVSGMHSRPDNGSDTGLGAKEGANSYAGDQGTSPPLRSGPTSGENMQQNGNPGYESTGPSNNEDDGSSSAGVQGLAGGGDRGFAGGGDHGFSDAGDHGFSNAEDDRSLKDEGGDSSGPGSSDDD